MSTDFLSDSKKHWWGHDATPDNMSLDSLRHTQWVPDFEQKMRNRLIMGAFRYGDIHKQDFSQFDMLADARRRLNLFEDDGCLEHLVDVANLLMLHYLWLTKQGVAWTSIDDGKHNERIRSGI